MRPLFFDLFRKSPFGPLREHMAKVRECIELLRPLFESVLEHGDEAKVKQIVDRISKVEHDADIIKNDIRQHLPSGLFLPVNREDLLAYLKVQDDIADSVEDVAVLMTLKELKIPDSLHDDIFAYVDRVLEVCRLCERAEGEFERLVDSAFGQGERDSLMDLVAQAEHAEWEADKSQNALAKKLLALEGEMSPVDIFLLFKIFGELGKVANHAEKTGDRLRRLLIKG